MGVGMAWILAVHVGFRTPNRQYPIPVVPSFSHSIVSIPQVRWTRAIQRRPTICFRSPVSRETRRSAPTLPEPVGTRDRQIGPITRPIPQSQVDLDRFFLIRGKFTGTAVSRAASMCVRGCRLHPARGPAHSTSRTMRNRFRARDMVSGEALWVRTPLSVSIRARPAPFGRQSPYETAKCSFSGTAEGRR